MATSLYPLLHQVAPIQDRRALYPIAQLAYNSMSSQTLSTAGLALKAGGSTLVKTGAAVTYLIANGVMAKIAAATDMPALVGTVTNAKFNVFVFFNDGTTTTSQMGTEGASLATLKFPPFPNKQAVLGFVIINPTGTGNFVGGTTALDDGTVVPTAVYISTVGDFDPSAVI